jgi:XTP/dITP diphosphohydrolase
MSKELLKNKIVVATNNLGKFSEISSLLSDIKFESISPFSFNLEEPEENGKTFAENSFIKAKFYAQKTSLTSIADDSGLCVEALKGRPGIHSARFALDENGKKNFPLAFEKIFSELDNLGIKENEKPRAHFICNLCIYNPKNDFSISFEGRIDGFLTFSAAGLMGFGYDPIFIKNGMKKTFGEIDQMQKDKISHRYKAFSKMVAWLQEDGNNLNKIFTCD